MYYRAISQNKWFTVFSNANYCGDSITGDLRTSQNTLSVWKIDESDKDSIDYYCIITALNRNKLAKVDYVIFDEKDFSDNGIELKQEEGLCPAFSNNDIKKKHFDLINIGYNELGKIAKVLREKVLKNESITVTKQEIKKKILNCKFVDKQKLPANFF